MSSKQQVQQSMDQALNAGNAKAFLKSSIKMCQLNQRNGGQFYFIPSWESAYQQNPSMFNEIFSILQSRLSENDSYVFYFYGLCWNIGFGCNPNIDTAMEYYRKAMQLGNSYGTLAVMGSIFNLRGTSDYSEDAEQKLMETFIDQNDPMMLFSFILGGSIVN
jgi:TPR repeat protein